MSRWSVFRQGSSWAMAFGIFWAAVVSVVGVGSVSTPASAQNFWDSVFQQQQQYRRPPAAVRRPPPPRSATRRPSTPAAAVTAASTATAATAAVASTAKPGGTAADADDSPERPLMAVISLDDQRLTLYGADGVLATSRISSGRASHRTPTGIFGVLQKNRWHESNIYSGASMPYMQRLTWSGIALHEGVLPGYPASHGCIRLPRAFAARLFEITRPGFRVVIGPDELAPRAIVHPGLPQPRYQPAPSVPDSRLETASISLVKTDADANAGAVPAGPGLDPIAYARAERNRARSELRASEIALKAAAKAAKAAETWHEAEAEKLELAERRMASATGLLDDLGLLGVPPVEHDLTRTLPIAVADYMAAERDIEPARRREAEARSELQTARASRETAERPVAELKARIVDMTRRLETVSVMVSRKDGKVYVRQALRTVMEAPVTIRDAEDPIGHHVFVAWPPKPGETMLQWKALSMPAEDVPVRRAKVTKEPTKDGTASLLQAVRIETAATALDRIVLPDDVRAEIERLVFTGASLIVTDRGRGHDGAVGHDFAIETRH